MTPSRLYKYESFSAQSLENLKNQVIYFGSPKRFNDPYDCALFPTVQEPTDAQVERIRQHYLAHEQLDETVRRPFETLVTADLRIVLVSIGRNVVNDAVENFRSRRGVSCFAERNDNLLMWSHYADHHKGFCLGFRTDREPFNKLRQVKYSQVMPAFDLERMLCDDDFDQVLDLFCTKSEDWRYERERRCIHNEAATAFTYATDALSDVYFGPEATPSSFEIVALVLAGQNDRVKLWRGRRSTTSFSVEFEQVTYTSYLEAKQRGLIE